MIDLIIDVSIKIHMLYNILILCDKIVVILKYLVAEIIEQIEENYSLNKINTNERTQVRKIKKI